MKLTSVAIFAVGYVVGSRAGHERYAQIVDAVERTTQRLEAFSARHAPERGRRGPDRADGDA